MNFDAADIAAATGGTLVAEGPAGPILTDSRALVPGAWFLALTGERFDGHAFLGKALAAGVAGAIVSGDVPAGWTAGVVRVGDTTKALQDLGRAARDRLRCPVIGVTGSAGKTTTRALIALAVRELGEVHQTTGNLNNHLGVPMTLLAAPEVATAVVIELGTSSPGEIALLADIARPTVRLVVNVGPAHLLELGGLDGVAVEKGALFATARPGDFLCPNLDDPRVRGMVRPAGTHVIGWGQAPDATIRLVSARVDAATLSTTAVFQGPNGRIEARIPAPGHHIASNAAGALAVAYALGLDLSAAAAAFEDYTPVGMRLRPESLGEGITALNDTYNANPSSMEASLAVLAALPGRRVAVLGDMLELGADEASWHAHVAGIAAGLGLELLVLVGPRMSAAAGAAVGAAQVWAEADGQAVVERLRAYLRPGDVVLFKGSRGARVERILQTVRGDPDGSENH
jgi:UDP-N-acetylmuramoyl-tripeptide--D-alanyl-D-alanine ligase